MNGADFLALARSGQATKDEPPKPASVEGSADANESSAQIVACPPAGCNTQEMARQYVAKGWALVPIARGTKGPRSKGWNKADAAIRTAVQCDQLRDGVGLAHAWSGTCVLDVDDTIMAVPWLVAKGVDLARLLDLPDAVRISSGRPNRAKLLYRLPDGVAPLPSKAPDGAGLEFRCATVEGLTVQDVLPPSVHPDTGEAYAWAYGDDLVGHWSDPPVLPLELLTIWQGLLAPKVEAPSAKAPLGLSDDQVRHVLKQHGPVGDYADWLDVGMALHHETRGAARGLDLWDEWSTPGATYKGREDLTQKWDSFGRQQGHVKTMGSIMALLPPAADEFEDLTLAEASTPRAPRFKFLPSAEFMAGQPMGYLVKGVLPQAGLALVFGESGSGKSFWVLDLVACIARGVSWRGHRVRQGQVAYVCAEGVGGFRNRLQAYHHHTGVDAGVFVLGDAPNITDERTVGDLVAALKQLGPLAVVVLDTWAQVTPGANENSGEDMGQALAHCRKVHAETGALVLLIHHSGKDATRGARGWSGLKAAADVEIEVLRDDERRAVRVSKQKDGADGAELGFRLAPVLLGLDEDGDEITSCVVEHVDAGTRIKPGRVKLGSKEQMVLRALEDLEGLGGPVLVADLITAAVNQIPRDEGKHDRRREHVIRAYETLISKGRIAASGPHCCTPSDAPAMPSRGHGEGT